MQANHCLLSNLRCTSWSRKSSTVRPSMSLVGRKYFERRKYLGGFIGTNQARDDLVSNWSLQLENLCRNAKSEPQVACNGFYMRVLPNLHEQLKTLDEILNNSFIPAITRGYLCSQNERTLLTLPFNTGGSEIPILKELATSQYNDSKTICQQLVESIICLLYTSPSPRDGLLSRMPSSA